MREILRATQEFLGKGRGARVELAIVGIRFPSDLNQFC
jgi:hypothetical protein